MINMTTAREVVLRQFQNVTEIDGLVIRGEKLYENKPYAIAYIDLTDDIITRADNLSEFQERVLGEDFFQSTEQLRWNNYLYIVAGPNSISSDGYLDAKSRIEGDKHYARKRVVSEGELVELLGDSKLFEAEQVAAAADIVTVWAERLKEAKLDTLMEQPTPRTAVLENIGNGTAARAASPKKPRALSPADGNLTLSHLEKLEVSKFRPVHDGQTYSFGDVTLIVGPNGTGKTSLLEAIEFLYCGYNRRPASNISPRVKGTFANIETGALSTLESTSDSSRIRARCLAWYGRDERQGKAIVDAFTRFNFLDTDAAFRLSNELEPGDISRDLSRLLIGADAATLWDYLGKIQSALETEWEKSSSQIELLAETNVMLENELTQLRNAPSQAKSLSTTYRAAIRAVGWQGALKEDGELVEESERVPLEELAAELATIIALSLPQSSTPGHIRRRAAELAQAIEALGPVEERRLKLQAELRAVEGQSTKVAKEIDTLTKWYDFCTAQFAKALHAKQTAQRRAEAGRQKLGALVAIAVPALDESFEHEALENVEASTTRAVEASLASIQVLEASEKQFGIWEARYAKASQQLKAAAKILTEEARPTHPCPVCGTEHSFEKLLDKIEKITERTASSEPLKELQVELQAERERLADAQKRALIIQSLRHIAAQLKISQSAKIGEIVAGFRSAKDESAQADAALVAANECLHTLATKGLEETRFNKLRSEISLLLDDHPDIDDVGIIALAREQNVDLQTELNAQSLKAHAEYDAAVKTIHSAIEALGLLSSVGSTSNPTYTFDSLLEAFKRYQNAEMKAAKIGAIVKLSDESQFVELQVTLDALIASFDQALHFVSTESRVSNVLKEKAAGLELSKSKLERLHRICKNQRFALDVLEKIRAEASLEDATRSALESIRVQINDVFSRVHSPNEYEYDGYGDNILRTRGGHESRSLDEVSTGQRAAFALSIFLALNLTAKSAPPIVLIDDPIAHIDDLNALSFMDYLRDLAVHSRRQVFFATADSRVAALFEKKFAFLGSKFQKIELSKRFTT